MFPVLFQVGNFAFYSYGILLSLAFLIGTGAVITKGKREGINPEGLLDLIIVIFISASAGSRIAYVLLWQKERFLQNPLILLDFRSGGLAFHGGFLAAIILGVAYTKYSRLPTGKLADIIAPYVALGYAITRVGCLLNGCCFGKIAHIPWALPVSSIDNFLRHPTQLYGVIGGLIIFLILKALEKKGPLFPGFLMVSLVGLYSIYRFILEFFREEVQFYFFTAGQIVSIILFMLALLFYLWAVRRQEAE